MTRPNDYGDQYPSDADDVLPGSPTGGLSEIDYEITNRQVGAEQTQNFRPDTQTQNEPLVNRPVWGGVVIRRLEDDFPHRIEVLRQDGRIVEAIVDYDHEFEQYHIGETVALIESAAPDTWLALGKPRQQELPAITLRADVGQASNAEFRVPFRTKIMETQTDPMEGEQKILVAAHDGVVVLDEEVALYEITTFVTVFAECGKEEVDRINVGVGCDPTGEDVNKTSCLVFDKAVGFTLEYGPDGCCAHVSLQGNLTDSILNQKAGGGKPVWTTCPQIAGTLTVGALKIKGDKGTTCITSEGDTSIKMPGTPPTMSCALLYVEEFNDTCVKLGYAPTEQITVLTDEVESWDYCDIVTQSGTQQCAIPQYKSKQITVFDCTPAAYSPDLNCDTGCDETDCEDYTPCS